MDPTDKISEHFTYAEAIHSNLAKGIGMNNDLPVEFLPKIQQMADMILENVRAHFNKPIQITSWYRNPILNGMLSSKSTSQHILGEAVDFIVVGVPNMDVAKYIRDNVTFDQLILERTWIHCSLVSENNRKDILTCYDGTTYRKGLK